MPIKINGSTSGSVTLAAPATGSDVTLTLPTTALATESFVSGSYLPIAGGKILQIVRATDNTGRSTTSTSYVDVTGMSVSITPQKNTSSILIVMTGHYFVSANAASAFGEFAITNSANTAISGATDIQLGHLRFTQSTAGAGSGTTGNFVMLAYASPATTSATTYKLRWKSASASTLQLLNDVSVGQMYAIEVSA